jgi:alkyldihydroxyacetonephosphate synthase
MRLSDEAETASTMAMSGPQGAAKAILERYLRARGVVGGCIAILGWEGSSAKATQARREAAWRGLRRFGAVSLGSKPGQSWRKHRFEGPFLRDVLLDEGYVVETLETAGEWSALHGLHDAVAGAISGALTTDDSGVLVLSHVSHVYAAGASLYYTVIARAESDRVAQWDRAKTAACDAIMANGGTITHHHAVGVAHRPWMTAEVGELGGDVLRAIKGVVDPSGIMNPGKLVPEPAVIDAHA